MSLKNLLLFVLIMCLITACGSMEADAVQMPNDSVDDAPIDKVPTNSALGIKVGQNFKLGEGESRMIEDASLEITVVRVIEDSRCPTDVQCFWEGNVKVEVLVGEQSYILTLGGLLEGDQNSVDLGDGLSLRLLKVDPYPGARDADQPYKVTLMVERETSQPYQYPSAV